MVSRRSASKRCGISSETTRNAHEGGRRWDGCGIGYRRLHAPLRRKDIVVNHKWVAQLYGEEDLAVRRCSRKRLAREGRGTVTVTVPSHSNEHRGCIL
jgi:hypothetical protein